jgi:hypothetical protein
LSAFLRFLFVWPQLKRQLESCPYPHNFSGTVAIYRRVCQVANLGPSPEKFRSFLSSSFFTAKSLSELSRSSECTVHLPFPFFDTNSINSLHLLVPGHFFFSFFHGTLFISRNTWRRSRSTVLIDDRWRRPFGPFVLIFLTYLGPAVARQKFDHARTCRFTIFLLSTAVKVCFPSPRLVRLFLGKAISSRFDATLPLSQKYRDWVSFVSAFLFVDRTDFRDFHEVSRARQKSCVVLRFVLDNVPFGTPTLSEFPDLGSHGLFLAFRRPKKKTSRRLSKSQFSRRTLPNGVLFFL